MDKKMIIAKSLNEIVDGNKSKILFNKSKSKFIEGLRISLGTHLKNGLSNVKTIDDLNNFDFCKLSEEFLNKPKGLELKKVSIDNLFDKDLINSISAEFENFSVRRFYLENGGDKVLFALVHNFKEIDETKGFKKRFDNKEDIYYGEDVKDFSKNKKYKQKKFFSNKKDTITNETLKKDVLNVNMLEESKSNTKQMLTIENFYKNYSLKELCTNKLTCIKDFSPLIMNFLNSNKNLYVFNPPTGSGKSYSIRKIFNNYNNSFEFRNKFNKLIYITDTRENISKEYQELIKNNPEVANSILHILTNEDCILEHFEEVENLPDIFKELDNYNYLLNEAKSYKKIKEENLRKIFPDREYIEFVKNKFDKAEKNFRNDVKNLLQTKFKENNIYTIEEKMKFIEKDENLSSILEVYTNTFIHKKPILYATLKKIWLPIDTLIIKNNISFLQDSTYLKDSLYIFDEADEAAVNIKNSIIDETVESNYDLINKIITIYTRLKFTIFPDWLTLDETSLSFKDLLILKGDEYTRKYHLNYTMHLTKNDDFNWLFSNKNTSVISKKDKELYLVEENNSVYFKEKEELKEDMDIDSLPIFSEFSKDMFNYYYDLCRLIKKISNIYKEKFDCDSLSTAIENVLHWFGISGDDKFRNSIVRDISFISQEDVSAYIEYCGYENPGTFSKLEASDDGQLYLKLNSYSINKSPEKILLHLLKNGAKVILSSATAKNKSVAKNFDLEWEKFAKYKYEMSDEEIRLESDFLKDIQKYKGELNLFVNKTKDTFRLLYSSIESYFDESDKESIKNIIDNAKEFYLNCNRCSKNKKPRTLREVDNSYYFLQYLKLIDAFLNMKKNGLKSVLAYYPFNMRKDKKEDKCFFDCLWMLIEMLKVEGTNESICFCVNSSNIKTETFNFQNSVRNNNFSIFLTSYQTANKGLNLQIETTLKTSEVFAVNDRGRKELDNKTEGDYCTVKVDIEGLYIGNITHVLPSLNLDEDDVLNKSVKDFDKKVLNCLLTAISLHQSGDINDEKFEEILNKILNKRPNPFSIDDFKNSNIFVHKLIALIQQTVGRICRESIKKNNCIIFVDNNITDIFATNKVDRDFVYSDYEYERQPREIREVVDLIFKKKKHSCIHKDFSSSINDFHNFLTGIHQDNDKNIIDSYKYFRENIYKLILTREEYKELIKKDEKIKHFYMSIPNSDYKFGYSYNIKEYDYWDNEVVEEIYPGDKVSVKSLFLDDLSSDLLDKIKEKFDLEEKEDAKYILCPKGFETLKGNIGEFIGEYYLRNVCYLDPIELPYDIYEKMDAVIEEDDVIIAIDFKNYNSVMKELNDEETKKSDDFNSKLEKIKNYYKKPVLGIVLNTRYNKDKNLYKSKIHNLKNSSKVLTIPNIYNDDGTFNFDVYKDINKFLKGGI